MKKFIPSKGAEHRLLDGDVFLDLVGQPDLAAKYRMKAGLRLALLVSGVGFLAAGSAIAMVGAMPCEPLTTCSRASNQKTYLGVGGGLMGAGIVAAIADLVLHPIVLTDAEARALADEYNARRRKRLGLPAEHAAALSLQPVLASKGAGLLLQVGF